MDATANEPGGKLRNRQGAKSGLFGVAGAVVEHQLNQAAAIGEVEQGAIERAPGRASEPEELGWGTIEALVDPTERRGHCGVGSVGRRTVAPHVTEETAAPDVVDAICGHPVALLVGHEEGTVGVQADAVRSAK